MGPGVLIQMKTMDDTEGVSSSVINSNNGVRVMSTKTIQSVITRAVALRRTCSFEEALAILLPLAEEYAEHAELMYEIGWTLDASDRSREAIPYYRKALALGLRRDRQGCYLALGSSLRATGQYTDSREILEEGLREFNDYRPLRVFLALTLYNLKCSNEAVRLLIEELCAQSSDEHTRSYRPALEAYATDLDRIW